MIKHCCLSERGGGRGGGGGGGGGEMWLPILLLAVMASGSACPDFCKCRSPVIECRGHAPELFLLDELASTNFTELKIHEIEHQEELTSYVAGLPNSTFLQGLKAIEVTNCSILTDQRYLKWDVRQEKNVSFPLVPDVESFNISHNKLFNLPWRNSSYYKLRVFDASHNNIKSIDSNIDSQVFNKLAWLSLASNNLDYISPYKFRHLTSLEYLDLSDNVLHTLERLFNSLGSLQRLNVAGNKLKHVEARWFQNLNKLVELDISRNKLTFIPSDTLQSLASLSVFKLAENPLIERDLSLLLGTGLEIVDASRIGLVRVPAALTRSVRTLKLEGNQLTSINSGDLDSYPLLRLLDLSDNRLMIIEDDALGRLDSLEELILSGNILPTIPKSLPSGLKIFDLKQNAISKLTTNDLQGLYLLRELNLSGNIIDIIEGGSFRQLPALEKLDISDNPIKKLPSDTLSGPSNLVMLRMSGLMSLETEKNQNQDTAFPILTPERLVTLDVSRSPALAAQLLADNAALSACKSLQELDLSYANISAMRSDFAYVVPQLQKLNLIGNQWNCSVDQFFLGEWIRQHERSIIFSTRCATPIDLEGKLLEELPVLPIATTLNTKFAEDQTNTTTASKVSTIKDIEDERNEVTNSIESSSRHNKKENNATEDSLSTTNIGMKITPSPTPIVVTQFSTGKQEEEEEEEELKITLSVSNEATVPITSINEDESPKPLTTSQFEKNTLQLTTQASASDTLIDSTESNQNKKSFSTISNIEDVPSTTNDNKMVMENIAVITPESLDAEATISSVPPFTTSTPNVNSIVTNKTNVSLIRPKQLSSIKIDNSMMNKLKEKMMIHDEESSTGRVVTELSRSKLIFANEEEPSSPPSPPPSPPPSRTNDEIINSFVEELNNQATESGARTSESLTTGAHPGMLILLGAAIGAAAAMTVVLSRKATVKRRDRQYQRHENIEVHALTPTTELW